MINCVMLGFRMIASHAIDFSRTTRRAFLSM
jgi:hypothetical protein